MGCPNQCVFCNQRSISGHSDFSMAAAKKEMERAVSTLPAECEAEIAFFGGSFTGIERPLMVELLDTAEEYVRSGKVTSIRLSTRPDYIDDEILDILSAYSVRTIELGLQSMNDDVLAASKRGHDAKCAEIACEKIKKRGFSLVGQMMTGLPKSDRKDEIYTAQKICEMGADAARIYPTVVFFGTELADMMLKGEYIPPELEEAVTRAKLALDVFARKGVPVIRIGLCAGENLSSPRSVCGGANHSAIGELAMSALYLDRIYEKLSEMRVKDGDIFGKELIIYAPLGETSKVVGQKRSNIIKIKEKYRTERIKVLEKKELLRYNIIIEILS